jgi:hypothetical protein
VVRRLLPLAMTGLQSWGVDDGEAGELLDVIEQRCLTGQNAATWFVDQVHSRERDSSREMVLREVLSSYRDHMHANEPVHTWT